MAAIILSLLFIDSFGRHFPIYFPDLCLRLCEAYFMVYIKIMQDEVRVVIQIFFFDSVVEVSYCRPTNKILVIDDVSLYFYD